MNRFTDWLRRLNEWVGDTIVAVHTADERAKAESMATIRADQRIARAPVTQADLQRVVNTVNVRTGLILTRLGTMEAGNMMTWTEVIARLRALETVEDGMAALLKDIAGRVRDAETPEQRQALADELDQRQAILTAAIVESTPLAPAPAKEPAPVDPPAEDPPAAVDG